MRLFQLQRISAIALLVFLTIHMMVLHYPPFHIDFGRILERMADPLWKALDIAFLFFVLIHALSGTYAVLTDFDSVSRARKVLAGGACCSYTHPVIRQSSAFMGWTCLK